MKEFCNLYILTGLNNNATCYKNPESPSFIDFTPNLVKAL